MHPVNYCDEDGTLKNAIEAMTGDLLNTAVQHEVSNTYVHTKQHTNEAHKHTHTPSFSQFMGIAAID